MMNRDRRRYFRINDTLGVAYRILTETELAEDSDSSERPVDARNIIAAYDTQIEHLLSQLRGKDPVVSELMDVFNQKFNCILDQLNLDSDLVQRIAHKVQEVNISACGMAFVVDEELASGTLLSLDLLLLPANLHVFTRGIVLDSTAVEAGEGYHVRLEFSGMESQDQEVLIQHIVQRQSHLIRALREPVSPDESDA
jgi:c-di-GMP-binding flagellar brake protein YcgR